MPTEPTSTATPLFSPIAFWADTSMTALDTALSSTQKIGDGVDRITRAHAGADASALVASDPAHGSGAPGRPRFELALQMQSTILDLLGQAWQQWFTTLGTLATLGAGSTFKEAERQNPWLNTLRESVTGQAATAGAASAGSTRRQGARSEERSTAEHAVAAAGAERGSRRKSKKVARSPSRSRSKR